MVGAGYRRKFIRMKLTVSSIGNIKFGYSNEAKILMWFAKSPCSLLHFVIILLKTFESNWWIERGLQIKAMLSYTDSWSSRDSYWSKPFVFLTYLLLLSCDWSRGKKWNDYGIQYNSHGCYLPLNFLLSIPTKHQLLLTMNQDISKCHV